jgi:alpha-N-acetylglucosamine transferase
MKTLKLFAFGIVLFVTSSMQSQVSVNINIGTPPLWGPSGYSNVDYYYLPDVQAYYDIRASQFIYFGAGNWTRSRYLPGQYRNYDLYNGYKVVLNDYHGRTPYSNYKEHKVKYYKGYKGKPQRSIGQRENNNSNYSKGGNGEHQQGNGNNGHGNNGHGKGKH